MDEMRAFAMLTYNRTLTAKNKAPMIDELRAIVEAAGDQGKAAPAGVSPQVAGGGKGKGKAKPSPVAGKKRKRDDDAIPVGGAVLGDRVVALYRGDEANQWFPGRVTAVHSDDTYDIKYDDGDEDERLPACYLSTNVDRFDDE